MTPKNLAVFTASAASYDAFACVGDVEETELKVTFVAPFLLAICRPIV